MKVGQIRRLAAEFKSLAAAGEEQARLLSEFGETLEAIRREHPEWFDPETGYLMETEPARG